MRLTSKKIMQINEITTILSFYINILNFVVVIYKEWR